MIHDRTLLGLSRGLRRGSGNDGDGAMRIEETLLHSEVAPWAVLAEFDDEPLEGPTRVPILWEGQSFVELDPRNPLQGVGA